MEIGHFGKQIVFSTSDKKVLTPSQFTQKVSGEWSSQKRIAKKARKEFNGAGLRKLTFKIVLDATLGVKPRKTMEKIEKAVENGTAERMVVGGKAIGKNKFVITDISEAWDVVYNGGELARATLSVTMEEYL